MPIMRKLTEAEVALEQANQPTRLTLRLPKQLYEAANTAARRERRSLHGQLLWWIQCCADSAETQVPTQTADVVARLY